MTTDNPRPASHNTASADEADDPHTVRWPHRRAGRVAEIPGDCPGGDVLQVQPRAAGAAEVVLGRDEENTCLVDINRYFT